MCVYVCVCVSVWTESRSLQCITPLFIVRTNPRYERNPSTTCEMREGENERWGGKKRWRVKRNECVRDGSKVSKQEVCL